ncbi:hypothetical protein J6590_019546 [Homalodisca vitripennis]|nr:hypothetical protein J6590_019546 [Homalodisca vitripennis]
MYVDDEDLPRNKHIHHHNTRHGDIYNLLNHHLVLYENKQSYREEALQPPSTKAVIKDRQSIEDSTDRLAGYLPILHLLRIPNKNTYDKKMVFFTRSSRFQHLSPKRATSAGLGTLAAIAAQLEYRQQRAVWRLFTLSLRLRHSPVGCDLEVVAVVYFVAGTATRRCRLRSRSSGGCLLCRRDCDTPLSDAI